MHPLLPYLFYLFQVPSFYVPRSESAILDYTAQVWPGAQEHQIHFFAPHWGLGLEVAQLDPYERRTFRARGTSQLHEHARVQATLGLIHERLRGVSPAPTWRGEASLSLLLEPQPQWATFAWLQSQWNPGNAGIAWEVRQLYFIDSQWILTAGWRPLPGNPSPLLVGLQFHHEALDAYVLNQGNSFTLGLALHRSNYSLLLSLATQPLLPTQSTLLWRPALSS